MTSLVQKVEALAEKIGSDSDKLWHEFEAFIEGKHKVEEAAKKESEGSTEPAPAPESPPAEAVSTTGSSTSEPSVAATEPPAGATSAA